MEIYLLVAVLVLLLVVIVLLLRRGDSSNGSEGRLKEEISILRRDQVILGSDANERVIQRIGALSESNDKRMEDIRNSLEQRLYEIRNENSSRMEEMRRSVDEKLAQIQAGNDKKLEEMRRTVGEKLDEGLKTGLNESFNQVAQRLDQVHRGLGEMQSLAAGVGDLKKVLSNVKNRGTWGEVQLGTLLEQILSPGQFQKNIATSPSKPDNRVEFAVRLPGKNDEAVVYLPIDAKFPLEDYQKLIDAREAGDTETAASASKALELRIRACAKDVRDKYLEPPFTTDFAVIFLPVEGLYSEVLTRPGLADVLQNEYRVMLAGPVTLSALLNSLQMGFRTLAIERRTGEVWQLLSAVRGSFDKFALALDKTQKKLQEASNTIEDASRKGRTVKRKLAAVDELPAGEAQLLLGLDESDLSDDGIDFEEEFING